MVGGPKHLASARIFWIYSLFKVARMPFKTYFCWDFLVLFLSRNILEVDEGRWTKIPVVSEEFFDL